MSTYASPNPNYSHGFEDAVNNLDAELRRAAAYIDAVVVPQIRHETGGALRLIAGHLERLADRIDPQGMNQAGTNQAGTNQAGTNQAGMNQAGMNSAGNVRQ